MTPDSLSPLRRVTETSGTLLFLTGAGISAESGIPTFRGPDGHWTVGSDVYHPHDLATWRTFSVNPELVWPWYLWRRSVCQQSEPNPAHAGLVTLEQRVGDRFTLITQNVDGLHHRSGSSADRTFEIHGNINFFRCANGCSPKQPMPILAGAEPGCGFLPEWRAALTCTQCGAWMRPHVLWFDEYYNEEQYRFDSALAAINAADALIVVGTTGTTSLPAHLLHVAQTRGLVIVDINPNDNPFARAAQTGPGAWLAMSATEGVNAVLDALNG